MHPNTIPRVYQNTIDVIQNLWNLCGKLIICIITLTLVPMPYKPTSSQAAWSWLHTQYARCLVNTYTTATFSISMMIFMAGGTDSSSNCYTVHIELIIQITGCLQIAAHTCWLVVRTLFMCCMRLMQWDSIYRLDAMASNVVTKYRCASGGISGV